MPRVVTVWTRWGDYVLGVRDVRPGESLSVGARLLVGFRGPNAHVNGGQVLAEGETSCVSVDGLEYTLTCLADEAKGFARPGQPLWLFGAAALLLALQLLSRLPVSPSVPAAVRMREVSASARLAPLYLYQLADPVHDAFPVVVGVEPRIASAVTGGSRCGDADMGDPASAQTGQRYGVRGPRDNPDPHLARAQPGDGEANGLVLPQLPLVPPLPAVGPNGPLMPWGRETALGGDERRARGQMWGDVFGANRGEDGLGRVGWPGSVAKRLEVAATLGAPPEQLRVLHTGLQVSGGRKASEVGRSMAAHFDDFRRCGETAEAGNPHAVELDFEVTPDGHATATGQAHNGLEQCLEQSLSSVVFAPGASSVVQVRYPLYFVPAPAEPKPRVPRAPSLDACDCG